MAKDPEFSAHDEDPRASEDRSAQWDRWQAAILEAALDCIIVSDENGYIVEFNRAAEETFGYKRSDVLGREMAELIVPKALRQAHRDGLNRFRSTRIGTILGQRLEVPALHADGSEFMVELTVIKIDVPGPAMFVGYLRDISDRKKAEEALKLTQFSVDRSGDAIFWVQADSTVTYANDMACQSLGYSREELLGRSIYDFSVEFPREDWNRHWQQLKEQGTFTFETKHQKKDGTQFPVEITANYIEYQGHETNCAVARDISERKRNEAQLKNAIHKAQQASRAKSEFLALVSHEMRTPLNSVLGMLSLTLSTNLDATQLDYLRTSDQSARRLHALINDILDVSQIEAGRFEMRSSLFDPRMMLSSIENEFLKRARSKGLEFRCVLHDELPASLFGDEVRLRQIFDNLLDNALKFTSRGHIELELNANVDTSNTCVLSFSVSDTGPGIAKQDRARIFNRFEQLDSSSRRHYEGIGVGLTICAELVRLFEGTLQVEDAPGGGAKFVCTVYLPTSNAETSENPDSTDSDFGESSDREPVRVLLVEDDVPSQKVAAALLNKSGMSVTVAQNGREALDIFSQASPNEFDVILMDMMMPGMNGIETTAELRKLEINSGDRTPIVALTASAMKGDREKFLAADMDGYASKPIDRQALVNVIYAVTSNQRELPADETSTSDLAEGQDDGLTLNTNQLVQQFRGDLNLLCDVLGLFLRSSKEMLEQFEGAKQSSDFQLLANLAHRMKGSLANIRAERAARVAQELEQLAKTKKPDPALAAHLIDRLRGEYETLESEIREILDGQGPL